MKNALRVVSAMVGVIITITLIISALRPSYSTTVQLDYNISLIQNNAKISFDYLNGECHRISSQEALDILRMDEWKLEKSVSRSTNKIIIRLHEEHIISIYDNGFATIKDGYALLNTISEAGYQIPDNVFEQVLLEMQKN